MVTAKNNSDKDKIIKVYEESFNQLIEENQRLKSIALRYKEEYEQINLNEQDIKYLQETATRLIKLFTPENSKEKREKLKLQGFTVEEIKKVEITNQK